MPLCLTVFRILNRLAWSLNFGILYAYDKLIFLMIGAFQKDFPKLHSLLTGLCPGSNM